MALTYAILQQQGEPEQKQDTPGQGEGVRPATESDEATTLPRTTVATGKSEIEINTKE